MKNREEFDPIWGEPFNDRWFRDKRRSETRITAEELVAHAVDVLIVAAATRLALELILQGT